MGVIICGWSVKEDNLLQILNIRNCIEKKDKHYFLEGFTLTSDFFSDRSKNSQRIVKSKTRANEDKKNRIKKIKYQSSNDSLLSKGKYYSKKGEYSVAIPLFFEALTLQLKNNDRKATATTYRNIGDAYLMLNSFEEAENAYKNSIDEFKLLQDNSGLVESLTNYGLVYFSKQDYREAIRIFESCFPYQSHVKNTILEASYLSNLGSCYRELNDFKTAENYFKRAIQIFEFLPEEYNPYYSTCLLELAKVELHLKNSTEALRICKLAESLDSENYGNNLYLNYTFYTIYKAKNKTKEALYYFEKYNLEEKKAHRIDEEKRIGLLKNHFELEKSKEQNELLEIKTKTQKKVNKLLLLTILTLVCFLAIMVYTYFIVRQKNRIITFQKNELNKLNADLDIKIQERTQELLEANTNLERKNFEISEALFRGQALERKRVAAQLHDNLGSTLSALKWRLSMLDSSLLDAKERTIYESIKLMMSEAYEDVRNLSHNLIPENFEQIGLIGSLEKLINSLNQSTNIKFSIKKNSVVFSTDIRKEFEIYSICLELINNVLRHSEASIVFISIEPGTITIRDNGVGFDTSKRAGRGINNILERVTSIGSSFEIQSSKTGTIGTLKL